VNPQPGTPRTLHAGCGGTIVPHGEGRACERCGTVVWRYRFETCPQPHTHRDGVCPDCGCGPIAERRVRFDPARP
jgi:hypothetical protein